MYVRPPKMYNGIYIYTWSRSRFGPLRRNTNTFKANVFSFFLEHNSRPGRAKENSTRRIQEKWKKFVKNLKRVFTDAQKSCLRCHGKKGMKKKKKNR